jgi:hypothetical protein
MLLNFFYGNFYAILILLTLQYVFNLEYVFFAASGRAGLGSGLALSCRALLGPPWHVKCPCLPNITQLYHENWKWEMDNLH